MSASMQFSRLQQERLAFKPVLPSSLAADNLKVVAGESGLPTVDREKLAALFPSTYGKPTVRVEVDPSPSTAPRALRVGAVLSGGQAAGGHNVIAGIYDAIKKMHPDSVLFGFLDGPKGLFTGKYVEIDDAKMNSYRNMGGFDIIGSGRDKIETAEQFSGSREVADRLGLDGIVVIGGDDSNTNAALVAEYFAAHGCATKVVGCPKTIDGDLKIAGQVDISFGFDTACKIYSELIGNVCLDALSSGKYWNFIRLMGRAASNITLECALQTHPNVTLIGEEVAARKQNLATITEEIVHVIVERAQHGRHHGVVLVPEGLIEFVPEVNALLKEINELLAAGTEPTIPVVSDALSANNAALFAYLPGSIKKQLLAERDPHGNVQVSLIETEKLLAELVQHELDRLKRAGKYNGSFTHQCMFFGYEARCGLPSDFDTAYCYALGFNAAVLLQHGQTGMMSSVTNLGAPIEAWQCGGVSLISMMNLERRKGKDKPVIKKALVELRGLPFRTFAENRHKWAISDCYRCPGPIQLDTTGARQRKADGTHVDPLTFTLALELKERETGHAHHVEPHGDTVGYQALCEALLSGGLEDVSSKDVHRLHMYRVSHGISDEDHVTVLRNLGFSPTEWTDAISKLRKSLASSE